MYVYPYSTLCSNLKPSRRFLPAVPVFASKHLISRSPITVTRLNQLFSTGCTQFEPRDNPIHVVMTSFAVVHPSTCPSVKMQASMVTRAPDAIVLGRRSVQLAQGSTRRWQAAAYKTAYTSRRHCVIQQNARAEFSTKNTKFAPGHETSVVQKEVDTDVQSESPSDAESPAVRLKKLASLRLAETVQVRRACLCVM